MGMRDESILSTDGMAAINGSAAGAGRIVDGENGHEPGVMTQTAGVRAIILAGGSGSRFTGSFIPKQFVQVKGKPILAYVLSTYQSLALIDDITLVINRRYEQLYYDIVDTYGFYKVRRLIPGGATRQASSW